MAQAKTTDRENGATRKSKLIAAINQTDPNLAYNPFHQNFAVQGGTLVVTGPAVSSETVQSTFREAFIREGATKLASADFRASGDVVELWGGNTVGLALGGEYRREDYSDERPPFAGLNPAGSGLDPLANDFLGFSPNPDTIGDRTVSAAYVETLRGAPVGDQKRVPKGLKGLVAGTMMKPSVPWVMPSISRTVSEVAR